ncbi:MAG: BspA family leucine-rich repeat surface protein [Eubacterium sp.]|nr:BspA family leucine-rich repeat surface protein [Eubacterium sp.]
MRKKENFKNLISDTMDNDQRRGFTMVELIVVLVIVAILSAVVIPLMMGFIENAREKEYITDAEAALKASQSALTEVYNNASNRITPERREKAHSESGTDINSRFDIWTAAILEDGITPAISDNISSYSVTYAEFTAEDGTRVFYNGSEWTVYKKDAEIEDAAYASLSSDADNVIHMWPYRGDKAYDPKAKPYVNNDFEDKIEFDFDGFKVLFIEENEDGRLVFNDNEYSHEVSYSEEGEGVFSETAAEIESIIKLDAKYKSVKWLYTGEEGVYRDDISQALAYAKELYENDKVQNGVVVFKADLLGDTAAFTAFFAPYKEDTQTVSVEGTTDDTNSLTFEIDKVSKEIKCVNKPDFDITKDDLDFISASQNSLIKDAGAVTSTGDWLHVENAGTGNADDSYEMSNGSYKIYSLDSDGANVKDYIIDSLNALAEDEPGADSDVTFKTPAYIHKTVHLRAYDGEKNETDDFMEYKNVDGDKTTNAVDFSPVGSESESPKYDIGYVKSEISDVITDETHESGTAFTIEYEKDENDQDVPVLKKTGSDEMYKISDFVEWEAVSDGERFKYWYLYDSDKNYDSDGNIKIYGTEQKERPSAKDGNEQRDCTSQIIDKLFAEDNIHYGEVAEIDLADLNTLLINNGEVDVTDPDDNIRNQTCVLRNEFNKLVGMSPFTQSLKSTDTTNENKRIRCINYITQEEAAEIRDDCKNKGISVNQVCLSTTKLAGSGLSLDGWDDFDFTITEMDPDYPAYVVAFAVPIQGETNKYNIYVFSEDNCYIKAISTFQSCFHSFTAMEENTFISHLDTSEVTRLKLMFCRCTSLTSLNISNISAKNSTDTTGMFANCEILRELHIENINTTRVRYFENMFLNCNNLCDVYTANNSGEGFESGHMYIDLDSAYDIHNLFMGCNSLKAVTLSGNPNGFTPLGQGYNQNLKVTRTGDGNVEGVFANCTGIEEIYLTDLVFEDREDKPLYDNGGNPKSTKITFFSRFIPTKTNLKKVIVKNCAFPNIQSTHFSSFFKSCTNLEEVVIANSRFDSLTGADSMFRTCTSLKSIDFSGTTFNSTSLNMDYMFEGCSELKIADFSKMTVNGTSLSMKGMFMNCTSLKKYAASDSQIDGMAYFDSMFSGCKALTSVDFTGMNINSTGLSASAMFRNCTSLTGQNDTGDNPTNYLNLSAFNGGKIKTFSNMFEGCTSLRAVALSTLDTSAADAFNAMFLGCTALGTDNEEVEINISHADNVTDFFKNCSKLYSVKFTGNENLNSTNVKFNSYLYNSGFTGCNNLRKISYNNLKFTSLKSDNTGDALRKLLGSNTIRAQLMEVELHNLKFENSTVTCKDAFNGCKNLEKVTLDRISFSNNTSMANMFKDCHKLKTIIGLNSISTSSINNMSYMFDSCYNLEMLDLSSFDTSGITNNANNLYYMFGTQTNVNGITSSKLTTIYVSESMEAGFKKSNLTNTIIFGDKLTNLVGGNETSFNSNKNAAVPKYNKSPFAVIDKNGQPGYFTQR